jgi:hypothetical protein
LFFETANAYQKTEALTAIELELFTAIGEGPQTIEDIAARCQAATRGTRILWDFLVVNGFLNTQGGRYTLTHDSAVFLDQRSSAYIGGAVRFLNLATTMRHTRIWPRSCAKAQPSIRTTA